jgi:hypothetical protein
MPIFIMPGRLQALAVVLCLSACSEEVAMSGIRVAAADEAAVLRLFDEVLHGGRDHVPAVSMVRVVEGESAESWQPGGAS